MINITNKHINFEKKNPIKRFVSMNPENCFLYPMTHEVRRKEGKKEK